MIIITIAAKYANIGELSVQYPVLLVIGLGINRVQTGLN